MFNSSRAPLFQKKQLNWKEKYVKRHLKQNTFTRQSRLLQISSQNNKRITSVLLFVSIKGSFEDKKIINKFSKSLSCGKINTNVNTCFFKIYCFISLPRLYLSPKIKQYNLKLHKLSYPMVQLLFETIKNTLVMILLMHFIYTCMQ